MKSRNSILFSALLATGVLGAIAADPRPALGDEPLCVLLLNEAGAETLINRCRDCREVTLSRSRPGESVPNIREMMLPGAAATPAPFRGPGRTRIMGERACPPVPGSGVNRIGFFVR